MVDHGLRGIQILFLRLILPFKNISKIIPYRYGIKEVKKVKRLSGPGLDTEDVPGVMQGGGKWPQRYTDFIS